MTIGKHAAVHIRRNLHLLGKPEHYGAAFEMIIRIAYLRCHPHEWRNRCEEVRAHLEDLVIATAEPGHTLEQERDGFLAEGHATRNRHGSNVLGESDHLSATALDRLLPQVTEVRPRLLQWAEEKWYRNKARCLYEGR